MSGTRPGAPTTRFSTALIEDCCTKRVISFAPIEKPCQLMIEPGVLVICSVRASGVARLTVPLATRAPFGFASAGPQNASMTQHATGFSAGGVERGRARVVL